MADTGVSSAKPQKSSQGFTTALVSAILEWLLIFLLFTDAIFAYIIKKFAFGCKLQTPCLLCSRLDHVLGMEKRGYYWDLMCSNHRSEVSSSVLCRDHNKIVDVHGMCENCLLSLSTINESNSEAHRLLVGKLGENSTLDAEQDPLLGSVESSFSSRKHCSCCNEPLISRGHARKFVQRKLSGPVVPEINSDTGLDPLPHVVYTELKITSDTESEIVFSDDDRTNAPVCGTDDFKEELEPRIMNLVDDLAADKLINPTSVSIPLLKVSEVPVDTIKVHGSNSTESSVSVGYGLEELNWHQPKTKADVSISTEPTLDTALSSSDALGTPIEISKDELDITRTSENGQTSLVDVTRTSENGQTSLAECEEVDKAEDRPIATSETAVGTNAVASDTENQVSNTLELGDAYRLAVGNRGKQLSDVISEQWNGKDSSRASEDFKTLLKQLSSSRGMEQSVSDMSPKVSINSDDMKTSDSCNAMGMYLLQKRISLERNESGLSLDGSIISEIEGESVVDRLKRQIEHDKKLMTAMYRELEEERNASAISTNQAMAMITRLQEEKAALQMEALQYLRMMEEQAEYDNEKLENTSDLLAEKEKEIQDLEAELEYYRNKYPNESMLDNLAGTRDIGVDLSESGGIGDELSVLPHPASGEPNPYNKVDVNDILLGFEDDKKYIVQCLKKLEKTLCLPSKDVSLYLSEDHASENGKDGINESEVLSANGASQENSGKEEIILSVQDDTSVSGLNSNAEGDISSLENTHLNGKDTNDFSQKADLASLGTEVSRLTKMLEALEADRKFLEHTINSLRTGDKGFQFIQEIAFHLQELRKVATKQDQTVA
ncbi:myosin-binding protein 1 isoform X1 [Ziziphus jujuba]|uniref:Myosin-binding protein 1 isoform X1 n=2 Tax=Ziziphus jujuba TaxID=326968 RepID=A0A6P3ZC26_ZIZJJ|nr:myosin-binding protein 1 isoform X1 [Ziziphus jujuba]XP_015875426.2 myosin-binding protein 1 isoform X1 [Ziziphus jujuba]KAH7543277.1 hypothetical protein FEM48_Zijuj02G0167300 [Ziziphus jujuba var. spinosa]